MLFSESSLIRDQRHAVTSESCSVESEDGKSQWQWLRFLASRLALYLLLFLSLFLLSTPELCSIYTPGYSFLAYITPRSWYPSFLGVNMQFHGCVGSALFAGLLVHWKSFSPLPPIFNSDIAQYFGRISYSLYIIHGPMLQTFGHQLVIFMWRLTGRETTIRIGVGWAMAYCVNMFAATWLADLFTRAIDEPFVRLAHRLEKAALCKSEGALRLH